jgi:hypothetical protein
MAYREFEDVGGRRWEAWDIHPPRVTPRRSGGFDLPEELRDGWLAFQTDGESRRLAPIPGTWSVLSETDLAGLLDRAKLIPRAVGRGTSSNERRSPGP